MNATEQLSHYRSEIKPLNEQRADIPVSKLRHLPFDQKSWFIAQDILNRLEMGIEKFGPKAFPLTDAQVALIEKIIKAERERLAPMRPAPSANKESATVEPERADIEEKIAHIKRQLEALNNGRGVTPKLWGHNMELNTAPLVREGDESEYDSLITQLADWQAAYESLSSVREERRIAVEQLLAVYDNDKDEN